MGGLVYGGWLVIDAVVGIGLRLGVFALLVLFALMQKERKRSRLQKNS